MKSYALLVLLFALSTLLGTGCTSPQMDTPASGAPPSSEPSARPTPQPTKPLETDSPTPGEPPPASNPEANSAVDTEEAVPMLAVVNGLLIDGTGHVPMEDAVLLITGERIVAAGPRGAVEIPDDAHILDVEGATILPGFINAHVHDAYDADRLRTWAEAGVTTVRDEGILSETPLTELLALRDELAKDPKYARLVSAGYMLGPPKGYGTLAIDSAETARREIVEALSQGVDLIKFSGEEGYGQWHDLPLFSKDVMTAIVDTAHEHDALVSVHVCDAAYLEDILDAGVDDLAHIQWDRVSDDLIQRIVEDDVYVVPTLTVLEAYGALIGSQSNLRRFMEAGVHIALGNDYTAIPQNNFDHFELGMPMHEIRRMHDADMTPMQIIVAATKHAAHVCDLEPELGTLEVGKLADVLVVNGNPLEDLETLTDVHTVIHNGTVIVGE